MKQIKSFLLIASAVLLFFTTNSVSQTTIEQWLDVVRNDEVVGGEFHVAIKVKGTNLPSENTLGSLTIDIVYNKNLLSFSSGVHGAITFQDGYNVFFSDNLAALRYGATGSLVYPGAFSGYDLSTSYEIFGTAIFTILDDQLAADLFIDEAIGTNQIGLFDSHANSNNTGVINNQTLSPPINVEDEPLPVQLVSFTAAAAGNSVVLEWATASEQNNYGFQVERKTAGGGNLDWINIGFVNGAGTSSINSKYKFTDRNLTGDKYAYRLKQIDNNGAANYSNEIEIVLNLIADDFMLSQNYPNPFNPSTQIKFGFKESTRATLKVYNMIGETVAELFNGEAEAGKTYSVAFDSEAAGGLSSGIYIYELKADKIFEVRKMMLLK